MREPKRLNVMPDTGRVVIAHPSREAQAIEQARRWMTDYFLSSWASPSSAYLMNVDQCMPPLTMDGPRL